MDSVPPEKRQRRVKKISAKMIRYVQLKNQGLSRHQAALQAGYSKDMASQPTKLENQLMYKALIKGWKDLFNDAGLTQEYMVQKFKEWLEAQSKKVEYVGKDDKGKPMYETIEQPDYTTQLKAGEKWLDLVKDPTDEPGKVKRRLTLTEFVGVGDTVDDL